MLPSIFDYLINFDRSPRNRAYARQTLSPLSTVRIASPVVWADRGATDHLFLSRALAMERMQVAPPVVAVFVVIFDQKVGYVFCHPDLPAPAQGCSG